MEDTTETKPDSRIRKRIDHMANERTFLSWIRTAIGIMAFGFVVERFALFLRQAAYFLERGGPVAAPSISPGYSSIIGILLIAFGALLGLLSLVNYKKTGIQIENDTYQPPQLLAVLLTVVVVLSGIFLVLYLVL